MRVRTSPPLVVMSDLVAIGTQHNALVDLALDRFSGRAAIQHVADIKILVLCAVVVKLQRSKIREAAD
jgi:hypothetical protein